MASKYDRFELVTDFELRGDQARAIDELVEGLQRGDKAQVLLGVTGSGKTFTMAQCIARVNRPTLVMAHNKTLAAQLFQEFRRFFPHNAVEYFVSYYDYYQPEAYVPATDSYIEKEATINDEIDRMRLSATRSLLERRDVIIVASVSCIYGLGSPEAYHGMVLSLERFFARESCGWCTPCRDGLPWVEKILIAFEEGGARTGDVELLQRHCKWLGPGNTFCALAPGAVEPLQSALKYFRADFEAAIAVGAPLGATVAAKAAPTRAAR